MTLVGRWKHPKQLVTPTNLNSSHCNDNCKNDYHKYDMDLPVAKLDPFTTGAYVKKCVNQKLFPCCKFSGTTKMSICLWQWFLTKLEWEDLHLTTITSKWLLDLVLDRMYDPFPTSIHVVFLFCTMPTYTYCDLIGVFFETPSIIHLLMGRCFLCGKQPTIYPNS